VLGRGITNSRSNYDVAARVSKQEAKIAARSPCSGTPSARRRSTCFRTSSELPAGAVPLALRQLEEACAGYLDHPRFQATKGALRQALESVFRKIEESAGDLRPGAARKSDFFRDIAGRAS